MSGRPVCGGAAAPHAGPVSRAAGLLVDAGIITLVAFGTGVTVEVVAAALVGTASRELARVLLRACLVVLPVLTAAYGTVFCASTGRTPGMALLGIRVVSTAGRRVGWAGALVRSAVLVLFPVGALWCLVDRRGQAVHDKVSRTVVVYAARRR